MMKALTQERLREALDYDPATGAFTWRIPRRGLFVGDRAGYVNKQGYTFIRVDGHLYLAHRLAFLWVDGAMPVIVDHINGDPADNRWANLRACTQRENTRNKRASKANTSGAKGVYWDAARGKWLAAIGIDGRNKYLGRFATIDEAKAAYAVASHQLHGEFGRVA